MLNFTSKPPSCDGVTNITLVSPSANDELADSYRLVIGSVLFLVALPLVLFEFRGFPLGTLFSTLIAAFLMVVFQVVTERELYGFDDRTYLTAVFMLLGVQLLAYFFQREEVILKIFRKVLKPYLHFEEYLVRVSALCFVFSMFLTGDTAAAIITPVLLKFWESQERKNVEIESLALGVMTSCNIGSMALVFSGLPIILVVAKTSSWQHENSRIDLRACIMYLLPIAGVAFLMNLAFLLIHYKIRHRRSNTMTLVSENSQLSELKDTVTPNGHATVITLTNRAYDCYDASTPPRSSDDRISAAPCQLETIPEDEILEISSSQSYLDTDSPSSRRQLDHGYHSEATILDSDEDDNVSTSSTASSASSTDIEREERGRIMCNTDDNLHQLAISYRPSALQSQTLAAGSTSADLDQTYELSPRWGVCRSLTAFSTHQALPRGSPEGGGSESLVFWLCLAVLGAAMLGMAAAAAYTDKLDIGLVPLSAGLLAVLSDAALHRRTPSQLVRHTDWSWVLLLLGLVVWARGAGNTGLLRAAVALVPDQFTALVIGAFVIVAVNFFGPALTVLLAVDVLKACGHHRDVCLYAVVLATLAGNATLFGTPCNVIVAQKCSQILKQRLSFCSHAKFGVPTSFATVLAATGLLYGLLQVAVP